MPHTYGINADATRFATKATSVAGDALSRNAADVDAQAKFPEQSIAALAREGLLGLCVPTSAGGAGQGPRTFAAVVEELTLGCASSAMIFVMHVAAQQAIAASLSPQKDDLLKQIASGKHLTTLAFSEKGSRSQFWMPMSKLAEQDGGFVTNAFKSWVTSANKADSYVSSAQKPGAASPFESTLYLVRRGAAGVRPTAAFNGLGLRGNDSAPVSIEGLKVAKNDVLTPQGEGAKAMLEVVLPWFSIGTAAMANGLCRAAVTATAKHLQESGFDSGSKLRDFPTLRASLAQMSVRTEQARALLGYTLGEMESPSPMTPLFVLQTRLASLQAAVDVTDLAMKACGGAAFSKQLPVERFFRDARAGWVMAPTVEHLQEFVGRALTGLPLF